MVRALAVGELHLNLLALVVLCRWIAHVSGLWRRLGPGFLRFWLNRLAIPLRVAEMMVRLYEVVDREVVLAIVKPRAAPDDLLELDHRIDGPHQTMLRMLRASTPVESFCEVVRMVGWFFHCPENRAGAARPAHRRWR
jgi:hypothetical protein